MAAPTIAIDARMIHHSGIGTYLQNTLPILLEHLAACRIYLLGDPAALAGYAAQHGQLAVAAFPAPIYSLREQLTYRQALPPVDLLWVPHYNIPLAFRGKLLVTVHDIAHLVLPTRLAELHKLAYAKLLFAAVARKADAIITVSNFTKNELRNHLPVDEAKVNVVHNGVSQAWFDAEKNGTGQDRPPRPYLLYVGNVKPHKNLVNLVKAFQLLSDKIPHDLLIVGKKEGFITGDKAVFAAAQALGERIQFTGFVADDRLKQLMRHADALVFPSLYEGFGLPPLEAMACGCPAVVANAGAIPEVCGDAALYFEPTSVADIAGKISLLLSRDDLRAELARRGRDRARSFSWEKAATATAKIIESLL